MQLVKLVLAGTRIVIPQQLRCHVLELAHEGHLGIPNQSEVARHRKRGRESL